MFSIQSYSYTRDDIRNLRETGVLNLTPDGYVSISVSQYLKIRKSIRLYERLVKSGSVPVPKVKGPKVSKWPAGTRWITIHPHGEGTKGIHVLIRDHGDGTAHVIAGAGGKLNFLKLNNIKSKEEYERELRRKKEEERERKIKEKQKEKEMLSEMSKEERKAFKQLKKQQKMKEKQLEKQKKEVQKKAALELAEKLGWHVDDPGAPFDEQIREVEKELEETDPEDKFTIKQLEKEIEILKKAKKRAEDREIKNILSQAKEVIRDFQREIIQDKELKEFVEKKIEETGAEEVLPKETEGKGKGFKTEYKKLSGEKGDLTEAKLQMEKKNLFEKRMEEIRDEHGEKTELRIRKGIAANKNINEAVQSLYEKSEYDKKINDLDRKTEALKSYLEYKKTIKKLEESKEVKEVQVDFEGNKVEEVIDELKNLKYGNGVKIDFKDISEELAEELQEEEEKMLAERQSWLNASLLEKVKENKVGIEKWVSNGVFNGFNALGWEVLGGEVLSRDVVDILGIGNAAKLLAYRLKTSNNESDFEDLRKAIALYHQEMNEIIVKDALERGEELIARAKSIEDDIANNPDDLKVLEELNEARLEYLNEANRVMGQALGSLEVVAALVAELEQQKFDDIEANLGKISTQEAIVRARALGLKDGEYEIDYVNGDRILTIKKEMYDRLVGTVDKEVEKKHLEVQKIKSGAEDQEGWLPAGVVYRPVETFDDPGPNINLPPTHIDNQEIGNTRETVEAVHRTLGAVPEGAFAFKDVRDLSFQEQLAVRKYWEQKIYKGSFAERFSEREYQQGERKTATGIWNSFLRKQARGDKKTAFDIIRQDIIQNHSTENMFGEKELHPLAAVIEGKWETYRGVPGAAEHLDAIESLKSDLEAGLVENKEAARKEIERMERELPEKLTELYESAMREHYIRYMSGVSEIALESGKERQEKSPWAEFVRMYGDPHRAMQSVLDRIKGDFIAEYVKNHRKITKAGLKTEPKKISHDTEFVLAMLDKETRDRYLERADRIMKQYEAKVGRGATGKFVSGSRKDKAVELYLEDQRRMSAQQEMFSGEELKQEDGTEILTIGKRAEAQLASVIPHVAINHTGERYAVSKAASMSGRHIAQQRAIKLFERVKKLNLTFGTGQGKSLISLGAFTHLKNKEQVKRAIYAVPSVVQKQFGEEALKYLEPAKYRWEATPGLNRDARIEAYKNGNIDMVVMTHQSLRDDMVYLLSKELGVGEEEAKKRFNSMGFEERKKVMRDLLEKNGIKFDMLTIDESHYEVDRAGKKDSTLSNILSAIAANTEYVMRQSATPVKNDVSEAFSMLQKIDPDRFKDRNEFMKKYGVDSEYARQSLQKLIDAYNYANPTETGVTTVQYHEKVKLTPEQKHAYEKIEEMVKRARRAHSNGTVDVEAVKYLSPESFRNLAPEQEIEKARELQRFSGILKREAQNRIIHTFDGEKNGKVKKVVEIVKSKVYKEGDREGRPGERKPGIVFAHNLKAVSELKKALEKEGLRVAVLQGSMNGKEKNRIKNEFNPPNLAERKYDVLVMSDAGATGVSLQNSAYVINYDIPDTAWVLEQRNGRANRHGATHSTIEYHNLISDTDYDQEQWERVERKKRLSTIFTEAVNPSVWEDRGIASRIARVRQERINQGIEQAA